MKFLWCCAFWFQPKEFPGCLMLSNIPKNTYSNSDQCSTKVFSSLVRWQGDIAFEWRKTAAYRQTSAWSAFLGFVSSHDHVLEPTTSRARVSKPPTLIRSGLPICKKLDQTDSLLKVRLRPSFSFETETSYIPLAFHSSCLPLHLFL